MTFIQKTRAFNVDEIDGWASFLYEFLTNHYLSSEMKSELEKNGSETGHFFTSVGCLMSKILRPTCFLDIKADRKWEGVRGLNFHLGIKANKN